MTGANDLSETCEHDGCPDAATTWVAFGIVKNGERVSAGLCWDHLQRVARVLKDATS